MSHKRRPPSAAIGRLTYKPDPDGGLVPATLRFVRNALPQWRDDPFRPQASNEKDLNSQLADFLDARARSAFAMVRFKHEQPQGKGRTVDVAAHVTESETWVGSRYVSIYEPFLVIEAKRLPAPSREREREYVIGSKAGSGGIERFKSCLHGATVEDAIMIGYVESGTFAHWHETVNRWIREIADSHSDKAWSEDDWLGAIRVEPTLALAETDSAHRRINRTAAIRLRHIWVAMNPPK